MWMGKINQHLPQNYLGKKKFIGEQGIAKTCSEPHESTGKHSSVPSVEENT